MYWVTEEAMAEGAPARALAAGEKTELPPTLCLVREYEAAHPRPDLLEFVSQYQNAGGQIDLTVFEGEVKASCATCPPTWPSRRWNR